MARKNRNRNRPRKSVKLGGGGGSKKKKSGGGGGGRSDKDALRNIVLGMAIIGLIAAFFLMPVAGKPAFNHLLDLFPSDEATATQSAEGGTDVVVPKRGSKGKPMESITPNDQKSLDDLIKRKTKK